MSQRKEIKRIVKEFLKSNVPTLNLELACPDMLFKAVEEAGGIINYDDEPMDTNGWQYDYWQKAKYKDQKLLISGSGFYGDACIEKLGDDQ